MCILFIAVDTHPRYPLIIAANRDEYRDRPSAYMHHWQGEHGIVAGRDRRAGGTWFGVNACGRVAAVTNHRAAGLATTGQAKQSRGELVARFLRNTESVAEYGEFLRDQNQDFSPFNLIYGAAGRLHYFSNTEPLNPASINHALGGGFHSISNGTIDDQWPKMSRGVALLKACIATHFDSTAEPFAAQLAQVMKDQTTAADHLLPNTGITRDREKHLSSIFISGAEYGTRATTLLLGDGARFDLYEYNYVADGAESIRRRCSSSGNWQRAALTMRRDMHPEKGAEKE